MIAYRWLVTGPHTAENLWGIVEADGSTVIPPCLDEQTARLIAAAPAMARTMALIHAGANSGIFVEENGSECAPDDPCARWQPHDLETQNDWIAGVHDQTEEFANLANGITKTHRLFGREFAIVAEFPHTDIGIAQANAFMESRPDTGVLEVVGGRVIIASNKDKGAPV